MAHRPVFVVTNCEPGGSQKYSDLVREIDVEFPWAPGFAPTQKKKNIRALHAAARSRGAAGLILEASSKSDEALGRALSAFNLVTSAGPLRGANVEALYQGSKVFAKGGPFTDIYGRAAREAKSDQRLTQSGPLKHFDFESRQWPLDAPVSFYDWLYVRTLAENRTMLRDACGFDAFTDIEFNPKKSRNTQARSCALAVALVRNSLLDRYLDTAELDAMARSNSIIVEQARLI